VVETGPSYSTKRVEAAESMMAFVQAVPAAAQVAGDLIAKAQDWPMADEIAERLKKMLPPQLADDDEDDLTPEQQQAKAQAMQAGPAAAADAAAGHAAGDGRAAGQGERRSPPMPRSQAPPQDAGRPAATTNCRSRPRPKDAQAASPSDAARRRRPKAMFADAERASRHPRRRPRSTDKPLETAHKARICTKLNPPGRPKRPPRPRFRAAGLAPPADPRAGSFAKAHMTEETKAGR
jgi:hypothetical protein